jgi:hypothetical protein
MATALSGIFDSRGPIGNWRRRTGSLFAAMMRRFADTPAPAPDLSTPWSKLHTEVLPAEMNGEEEIRLRDREAALVAALLQGEIKY